MDSNVQKNKPVRNIKYNNNYCVNEHTLYQISNKLSKVVHQGFLLRQDNDLCRKSHVFLLK